MNLNLKTLYVSINDNRVIMVDTNLKLFIERFIELQPSSRNYQWFYREFKKADYFKVGLEGKDFYFQKLL
jgi:hypothetical protein